LSLGGKKYQKHGKHTSLNVLVISGKEEKNPSGAKVTKGKSAEWDDRADTHGMWPGPE